jgi:hypothetical protein
MTTHTEDFLQTLKTRELLSTLNDVRAYKQKHADSIDNWVVEYRERLQNQLSDYDHSIALLKKVLATREHVPNKVERAKTRKEKQLAKQNR